MVKKTPDLSLGARLRDVRKFLGFTQKEFAETIGISYMSYWNYENGKRIPDALILKEIKEVTDIDLNWLITGKGYMMILDEDEEIEHVTITDKKRKSKLLKIYLRKIEKIMQEHEDKKK